MINGSYSEHGPGKNGFIKKKSGNYRGCKPRDTPLLRFMKSNYKKYRAKAASPAQYEKTFIINESLFLSAIFQLDNKNLPPQPIGSAKIGLPPMGLFSDSRRLGALINF